MKIRILGTAPTTFDKLHIGDLYLHEAFIDDKPSGASQVYVKTAKNAGWRFSDTGAHLLPMKQTDLVQQISIKSIDVYATNIKELPR